MTTSGVGKRLTDLDVNAIFACLSNNVQPPERLQFKVIRVPHGGLKLSPPSLELDDGIYVLLRSPQNQVARVPSGFADKVLTDSDLASLARCPWSLSGPQYPKRKTQGVQQRYCYPRGNTDYSNDKGGAMWTTFDQKGRENIETRILHVYYSNKRAGVVTKLACKSKASTSSRRQGVKSTDAGTKRKKNDVGQGNNKKNKVAELMNPTEAESLRNALTCPSLLQGELLSPSQTAMSFELDSSLDFNSENVFDTSTEPNKSFSFMPVQSKDIDEINAARDQKSTYNQYPATHGYDYGPYAYGRYSYPYWSWNAHYGTWSRAAPSIPSLSQGEYGGVQNFSKRLKDLEDKLREEINCANRTDQPLKLKLLQNWAKGIAQKPLQHKKRPTLEPQKAATASLTTGMSPAGTQVAASTQVMVKVKVESPGTPSITP